MNTYWLTCREGPIKKREEISWFADSEPFFLKTLQTRQNNEIRTKSKRLAKVQSSSLQRMVNMLMNYSQQLFSFMRVESTNGDEPFPSTAQLRITINDLFKCCKIDIDHIFRMVIHQNNQTNQNCREQKTQWLLSVCKRYCFNRDIIVHINYKLSIF